jgi:hypothetical protein
MPAEEPPHARIIATILTLLISGLGLLTGRASLASESFNGNSTGSIAIKGEAARIWTDCYGNSVTAQLVGLHGATVLLMVDDTVFGATLAGLTDGDRNYVTSALEAKGLGGYLPGTSGMPSIGELRMPASQWAVQLDDWAKAIRVNEKKDQRTAEDAWNHLRSVRDPAAIDHLTRLIARESRDAIRTASVEALAAIGGPKTTSLLVQLAATDESDAVTASAIWALRSTSYPRLALAEFPKYMRAGRQRTQAIVSLKATGLVRQGYINSDRAEPLTDALISNLVIKEVDRVPYTVWCMYDSGGNVWPKGNGGFRAHRARHFHASTKVAHVKKLVPRQDAYEMLVEYTGVDHGYDIRAWRRWQKDTN